MFEEEVQIAGDVCFGRGSNEDINTLIVVWDLTKLTTIHSSFSPWGTLFWYLIEYYFGSRKTEGCLIKIEISSNTWWADIFLVTCGACSMLRVPIACGLSWSHSYIRKNGSVMLRVAIKWSLKVYVACSAALSSDNKMRLIVSSLIPFQWTLSSYVKLHGP